MSLCTLISGRYFSELLTYVLETEHAISRQDTRLLQHSTPALERWFDKPAARLPRQNGFPLAFVLLFFLLAFAANLLMLMSLLPERSPALSAFIYFVPSVLFTLGNLSAMYLISRGKATGLLWFAGVHRILATLSALLFVFAAFAQDWHHTVLMFATLLIMLLCRTVINGRGFILFVIFCRTIRITTLARTLRRKSAD